MASLEVSLEFASLRLPGHCPLGVWVIPSPTNIYQWQGVLFIHRGYYAGAIYRFVLEIPKSYPSAPPVVRFTTECFHPLVDQSTGRFDIRSRFPEWRPRVDFLCHVLHFIKSAFKRPGLERIKEESDAQNKEAFRLYRDQTQIFATLASQSAILSASPSTLQADSNSNEMIQFIELDDQQWQSIRSRMLGTAAEVGTSSNTADTTNKKSQ
ncbi:ubiquitin-conjugating enzyme/RWD-like protein [Melampsora americana]|nr:ubiquitin-conjugating enzyme/RWD-like protein [Melampsora americana]